MRKWAIVWYPFVISCLRFAPLPLPPFVVGLLFRWVLCWCTFSSSSLWACYGGLLVCSLFSSLSFWASFLVASLLLLSVGCSWWVLVFFFPPCGLVVLVVGFFSFLSSLLVGVRFVGWLCVRRALHFLSACICLQTFYFCFCFCFAFCFFLLVLFSLSFAFFAAALVAAKTKRHDMLNKRPSEFYRKINVMDWILNKNSTYVKNQFWYNSI